MTTAASLTCTFLFTQFLKKLNVTSNDHRETTREKENRTAVFATTRSRISTSAVTGSHQERELESWRWLESRSSRLQELCCCRKAADLAAQEINK